MSSSTPSLRRSQLFAGLPDSEIEGLLDAASEVRVQLGDVISPAREPDDALYIIASGKVRIVAATKSGHSVTIALLTAGNSFGESALQSPYPLATARAAGNVVVYRIPGTAVRALANREPGWAARVTAVADAEQRLVFLRTLDLFASLTVTQAREVADALRTVTLAPGQILFREGEAGESCYLVYRGELNVARDGPDGWIPIRTLTEGDVVGEIALLLNRPRNASIVALEETVVLEMTRELFASCASGEAFEHIVGRIASDRMIQIDSIVAEARSRPKIPRLVTSRAEGRFGVWKKSFTAVSSDQLEFAAEACLRTLDLWFRRTPTESREPPRPESWSSARSLDELGAEAESLGYLTRLVHVNPKDLSALKLPAVIQSGEDGFQTIYAISRGQALSAHTSRGLVREPVPETLKGWNHWALSIELVPEMSSAGITVKTLPSLLLPLVRPWMPLLFGLLAITLLMECLSLVEPFFSRIIVDRVLVYRDGPLLRLLAFGALFASLLRMCAMSLQQYMRTYPLNSMSASLQLNLFRHILGLATGGIAGWDTPRFLARFAENTRILDVVMQRGVSLLVDSASIVVYFFAMLSLNPRLSFVAALFLAGWAILLLVASPWLRRLQLATFNKGVAFEGFFLDAVSGIFTVKSIGAERRVQSRGMELLREHRKQEFRTQTVSVGIGAFSEALTSGSTLAILGYGAVLALSGEITAGQLIAFQALMGLTFGPINSLVGFWNDLVDLRGCLERTSEVFRLPKEGSKHSAPSRTLDGDVEFRNVTFHYPGSSKAALRDFTLRVRAGQKVALVGRSGSGKTTIANLLAALYDPSSGAIVFDSTDHRDLSRAHLRRQIGVVEQQPYLFNGTIRDNIAKARPAASFDDIVSVAMLAGLHSFVSELPMGYDTQIGEHGMTLSGGQKQRVVIARALLNQPRILVLDEATSALDTISESIIQQNLDRVTSGRTSFVIAHRLSTVRNADLIAVIDDGRLVEKGTHDELMAQQGLYHHLYARSA